jgi:hypothetical protein
MATDMDTVREVIPSSFTRTWPTKESEYGIGKIFIKLLTKEW